MPRAEIMAPRPPADGLLVVFGIALFHTLEEPRQHQRHEEIEGGRDQERRGREVALHDAARGAQDVVERQHVDQGSVLDQGDGLVAHGRQHPLHHLRQHDAAQRLQIGHAQHLAAFVLAAVDRLDAGAEDLGEIGRVVQREGHHRRREVGQADSHHRHERQREVDEQHLQHERRAAHQPDVAIDQLADEAPFGDPQQRQHQAQRHGQRQRDEEQRQGHFRALRQGSQEGEYVVHADGSAPWVAGGIRGRGAGAKDRRTEKRPDRAAVRAFPGRLLDDVGAEPLGRDAAGGAVLLHRVQRLVELAQQLGVVLAHADAVVFGAEVVVQHAVFTGALADQVAAHHFVDHDGVEAAGGQVHQRGDVVAELLDFLDAAGDRVLGDGVGGAAAILGADHLAGQIGLGLHRRGVADDDDLVVGHVGRGEADVFLAFFGDGQAVPEHVDALAVQLGFLGAPVDRLEFDLQAQALAGFLGHVDVETDDLVVGVAETHGREVVIQADDDLAGGGRRLRTGGGRVVGRAAGGQHRGCGHEKNSSQFFHIYRGREAQE